ncbi:MAG TPA: alpha/beta hydrolase [Solirubrobacteraceae bacterium]|jgi:pimeloyl-ACP methyl ester carboxylesterase|nr:alpha/beta hydrolase [Solirubrobacteraceae bacterium]
MTATSRQTAGSVLSGDVNLFYRRFGEPGATPVLILHGANYYDSRDWVQIAGDLGTGREVVTYDLRGYGLSSWSPNQDYSLDAHLLDIHTLLDHLGWEQAVFVGHSRGGSFTLRFVHGHSQRVAGLVLVDFSPGQTPGRSRFKPMKVGPWGPVYASLEQAHAATSRNPGELDTETGRARIESIFGPRDGGWVNVRRDPAFQNDRPNDGAAWRSELQPLDLWDALAGFVGRGAPAFVIRATESASYDEAALTRLRVDFGPVQVVEVESGHDVPGTAPAELVSAVRGFLSE